MKVTYRVALLGAAFSCALFYDVGTVAASDDDSAPLTCAEATELAAKAACDQGFGGFGCSATFQCYAVEIVGNTARAQLAVDHKSGPFMYRSAAWPDFVRTSGAWKIEMFSSLPGKILKPAPIGTDNCPNYRLRISRSDPIPEYSDAEHDSQWLLTYDFLLRTTYAPYWSTWQIERMREYFVRIVPLLKEYPNPRSLLRYQTRALAIRVTDDLRKELDSAAPANPRFVASVPDTRFDDFEEVAYDLCIRFVSVSESANPYIHVYFEPDTNLEYAMLRLRSVKDIKAVGLVKNPRSDGAFEMNAVAGANYATIGGSAGKRFYRIADSIEEIPALKAATMPEFRSNTLPERYWPPSAP